MVLIGQNPALFDAPTLEVALAQSPSTETKLILELLRTQSQIASLSAKKELLAQAMKQTQKNGKLSLFTLNSSLKRVSYVLTSEVKKKIRRIQALKRKISHNQKSTEEVNQVKSSLISLLTKLGLIEK